MTRADFFFVLGTTNTFLNLFRSQQSVLGKCGGTVVTTDATYQQMNGRDHNTIAVGSVSVDQVFHIWGACVASREDTTLHNGLFQIIIDHVEHVVNEAQKRCKENEFNLSDEIDVLGKQCFGFNANANAMRDLMPIVKELTVLPTWKAKIDVLVVDGQEAPRVALKFMFPEIQTVDCARHLFAALRRSLVGVDSKLKTKEERDEISKVINAIYGMHELTDTAMKNVLMLKCLQRMKEVSVPWYNYFLKENYHLKIYGRHLTQAAIPLTTNGTESSHKYQKVRITVTIRSKHIPEV